MAWSLQLLWQQSLTTGSYIHCLRPLFGVRIVWWLMEKNEANSSGFQILSKLVQKPRFGLCISTQRALCPSGCHLYNPKMQQLVWQPVHTGCLSGAWRLCCWTATCVHTDSIDAAGLFLLRTVCMGKIRRDRRSRGSSNLFTWTPKWKHVVPRFTRSVHAVFVAQLWLTWRKLRVS